MLRKINGLKDLYFIHIPKNGGTSITNWFRHYYNDQYVDIYGEINQNKLEPFDTRDPHFTAEDCPIGTKYFAICRNPYTRLLSLYNYLINSHKFIPKTEEELAKLPIVSKLIWEAKIKDINTPKIPPENLEEGFENFVRHIHPLTGLEEPTINRSLLSLKSIGEPPKVKFYTQKSFLSMEQPPMYILRHENLEEDFKQIQDYYNYYKPLPELNVSETKHATLDDYTPELADYVYDTWIEDFEYFGYDKELPTS